MSKYTIRIEFEGSPTREEYDELHQEMADIGFLKSVNGVDSTNKQVVVKLPTGLYYGDSASAASTVSESVYQTATAIRKVRGVFVAQTETWASQP